MVEQPDESVKTRLAATFEWLLINGAGRTFPLVNSEMEFVRRGSGLFFEYTDDKGFHSRRVRSATETEGEIEIEVTRLRGDDEKLRLLPRTPAAELSLAIEIARLKRANEIAAAIAEIMPGTELFRVSLDKKRGRLAKIVFRSRGGRLSLFVADVTDTMTHEALTASAMLLLEKLRSRKKDPIEHITIAAFGRIARNLTRLHTLLKATDRDLSVIELKEKNGGVIGKMLPHLHLSDLWRGRVPKLNIPSELIHSRTAAELIELAPDKIDVVFSRHGETIRFLGLPFARVRKVFNKERAWFGVGREQTMLTPENFDRVAELVAELEKQRSPSPGSKKHVFYRSFSEAWLGSMLRRDISKLDANLILSPLYNQFRTSHDKIDLLAIRKDGRLVIIELKTTPDRELILQAADYWRKIELQRRRGELARSRLFGDIEIIDKPALVYAVAPALCFHRNDEFFSRRLIPEIEMWRFDLHEDWRSGIRVIQRNELG